MGELSSAYVTSENAQYLTLLNHADCGLFSRLSWSPDGRHLALAHDNGVWLWDDGFAPAPSRRFAGHSGPVNGVAFSRDGSLLASASADTTVRVWSTAGGQTLRMQRNHTDEVNSVAFHPAAPLLASAGRDRRIDLFDMMYNAGSTQLSGHSGEITSLAFGRSYTLASGGLDKTIRLRSEGREQAVIALGDAIRDLASSADRKTLAAACEDGSVYLIDFTSAAVVRSWAAHPGGADCVAFSPDGALLVTGGRDGAVKLWDIRLPSGEPVVVLAAHAEPVLSVAFHPAGALMMTGAGDHSLCLWGVGEAKKGGDHA